MSFRHFAVVLGTALALVACEKTQELASSAKEMAIDTVGFKDSRERQWAQEAARLRHVAALDFDATGGDKDEGAIFAKGLAERVAKVTLKDIPLYLVKARPEVEKAMGLAKRPVDELSAVTVAKSLGVEGVYAGTIHVTVDERKYEEARKGECTRYSAGVGSLRICLEHAEAKIDCLERRVQYRVVPRLIDAGTGRIVYTNTVTGDSRNAACSDEKDKQRTAERLIEEARNEALRDVARNITP